MGRLRGYTGLRLEPQRFRANQTAASPGDFYCDLFGRQTLPLDPFCEDTVLTAVDRNRKALRKRLRHRRRELSAATQQHNAEQIAAHLLNSDWVRHAKRVAAYLAADGEVSLQGALIQLSRSKLEFALPVINGHRSGTAQMRFVSYTPGDKLTCGAFGLLEPLQQDVVALRAPNVVLLPLVGFDEQGHRLGMGGGYYDRYFGETQSPTASRPKLIGVAHEIQRVANLESKEWDVDLDAVVTEAGFFSSATH